MTSATLSSEAVTRKISPDGEGGVLLLQAGRYMLEGPLGKGGFGVVYLGYDPELERPVAVKVINHAPTRADLLLETYMREARAMAALDHPAIVPVHDVGQTEDGRFFFVSKYVDGITLAERMKRERIPVQQAVEAAITLAEALHHAHERGRVHRDIKPGNIMFDRRGRPSLIDFGLALGQEDVGGPWGQFAGTPAYMSPEQARSEGHLVDGRSDIFSLGVILYEMLAWRRAFDGDTEEILTAVRLLEPKSLRSINPDVTPELERIVVKAMHKLATKRFASGEEMAEALRRWRQTGQAEKDRERSRVIPKGLRSFGAEDASFFLDLLPGPRDADGLTETLAFWKGAIEPVDPSKIFRVGVIFGPSGCGKSSLMKAGLLPRLGEGVMPVFVEASQRNTERHLREALAPLADADPDTPLPALIKRLRLRESHRGKALLVIDQFEQWLHGRDAIAGAELIDGLRQCDGVTGQALLLVRDDYWMRLSEVLTEVEIEISTGKNAMAVDSLPPAHAAKVLATFGEAYGRLSPKERKADEEKFLKQAIEQLTRDGRVLPVRLAAFVEMSRHYDWTPSTLKRVGGVHGLGVAFLEEMLAGPQAKPRQMLWEPAKELLACLLPGRQVDIRASAHSEASLMQATGMTDRPEAFAELCHWLECELKLITPIRPEGGERAYQLAHDYLVPSIRDWLNRKRDETRRGRAILLTEKLAEVWQNEPVKRHLPSFWEWLNVHFFTKRHDLGDGERRMMSAANRLHGVRLAVTTTLLVMMAWAWWGYSTVERIAAAKIADVQGLVDKAKRAEPFTTAFLKRRLARTSDPGQLLPLWMARLPDDKKLAGPLWDEALAGDLSLEEFMALSQYLARHEPASGAFFRDSLAAADVTSPEAARCATALLATGQGHLAWPLLEVERGRTVRTKLLEILPKRPFCEGLALDLWSKIKDDAQPIRKQWCLQLIGEIRNLSASGREEISHFLDEAYRHDPDSGVHASAEWAMRQHKVAIPELKPPQIAEGRQWYHTKSGLPMAIIRDVPPGVRPFAISMYEFRIRDYIAVRPHRQVELKNKNPDLPFQGDEKVSAQMAMEICNEISGFEGIEPEEWCFEVREARGKLRTAPVDETPQRLGYRLPTQGEWEVATGQKIIPYTEAQRVLRDRPQYTWHFGLDQTQLRHYAWTLANSELSLYPVGQLRPTEWGLFDAIGNGSEICIPLKKDDDYPLIGGSTTSLLVDNLLENVGVTISTRHFLSFRLAKTMEKNPE